MGKNKNAMIRYFFLDRLLANGNISYSCKELTEKCSEMLEDAGYTPLYKKPHIIDDKMDLNFKKALASAKRVIQLDLNALQEEPFNREISRKKSHGIPVYTYTDPTQSLFSKKLSADEKRFVKEILRRLGRFSGIASFTLLDELLNSLENKVSLKTTIDDDTPIMSFEENKYLKNLDYLPVLFSYIAHKQPVYIHYQKFLESEIRTFNVHPYMLKQYSNRWYLICSLVADKDGKFNPELILNLSLDRIVGGIEPDRQHEFIPCPIDLSERYEEIIGMTFKKDTPVEKIIFAVSEGTAPYIETKPIHETQYSVRDASYQKEGYKIFGIECRPNQELFSVLSSFGDNLIVLSPEPIRQDMIKKVLNQMKNYSLQ